MDPTVALQSVPIRNSERDFPRGDMITLVQTKYGYGVTIQNVEPSSKRYTSHQNGKNPI